MKQHYDKVSNWTNGNTDTIYRVDEIEDKYKWSISRDYRIPVCSENEKVGSLVEMDKYRAVLLSLFTIYGALTGSMDWIIFPFDVVYIKYTVDLTIILILLSTAQLLSYALAYTIVSQLSTKLTKVVQSQKIVNENNNDDNEVNFNNNDVDKMRYNFENFTHCNLFSLFTNNVNMFLTFGCI